MLCETVLCDRAPAPPPACDAERRLLDALLDDLVELSELYASADVLRLDLPRPPPPPPSQPPCAPDCETGRCLTSRNEMASGQAQDSTESQPLLGAAIANDMDLTDISFNDFFSFTDDVGETLDREMHHSLFGDSGLGMDLGPLMGPPAELDHGADQLLPDIATQLFDEVAAAHDALPEGGITAQSREDLLAFFEERVEPIGQSLSCPVSPAAPPEPPPPPAPPTQTPTQKQAPAPVPVPVPRTVRAARAGQSLLKPSVTADLKLKARDRRRALAAASAPASRRATPASSRPPTPDGSAMRPPARRAPPAELGPELESAGAGDSGALRSLLASLRQRAAEEADPKTRRLLTKKAREVREKLKSTSRRAKRLSERCGRDLATAATATAAAGGAPAEPAPSVSSTCSETESVGSSMSAGEAAPVHPEAVSQLRTQCELLVKHVRRTSQSAPPEPLPLIEEVSMDSPDVQSVVSDTPSSQADSPLRQALWDHSYCSRGNSGASSPAGDADTVCKVPGYLGAAPAPSPLLEKVPPYVQGSAAPPSRKKLSLSEYRQRRSALSSRSGSPDQPPPPPLAEREVEVASLPPPPPPVGAPLAPAAAPAAAPAPGQVLAKDAAAAPAVAPAAAPVRSRASSPPRGYRLDATSPSGRADSDRSSSRRGGRFSTGSASSSASSSRSSSASRCRSPDDPLRYSPSDFDIVSRPSRPTRPGRRRSLSRSRSRSPRVRSRSPLSRGRSPRSRSRSKSRSRSRRRPADSRSRRQQREERERERERERRRREEARREERRRQEELANQRDAVDRKVVYVNGLAPTVTRDDLRKMFSCFGVITKIRIKERDPSVDLYREQRDGCYAFITYVSHSAAVAAQAHGSARFPHLEVKFGGRREFCLDQYADQDADLNNPAYYGVKAGNDSALDFDTLLQMEMQRVKQAGQAKKVV